MKKWMRVALRSLVAVCLLGCVLLGVSTARALIGETRCGNSVYWELSEDGVLTLTGTGTTWDYTLNYDENWNLDLPPWYYDSDKIKSVVIGEGITSIGKNLFFGAENLESISIPESVAWIGESALEYCGKLKTINIPKKVSRIGKYAFHGTGVDGFWTDPENQFFCSDAQGVLFNKNKTILIQAPKGLTGAYTAPNSVVTVSIYAFLSCDNLTELNFGDDLQELESYAISGCKNLKKLAFSGGPESLNSGCYQLSALEDLTIGSNTSVLSAFTVFEEFTNLSSIHVSEENPYFCDVDGVLYNKDQTKLLRCPIKKSGSIAMPNTVTEIGYRSFKNCFLLEGVIFSEGITELGAEAFFGCSSLETVKIPGGITVINRESFQNCTSLKNVELPEGLTHVGRYSFNGCTSLEKILLPETVVELADAAFSGCTSLKEIYIPNQVQKIESAAFSSCKSLEKVVVGKNVELIIANAFANCTNLKEVRFTGKYPFNTNYSQDVFLNVVTTCYYPDNILSWAERELGNFGGTITWVAEEIDEFAGEEHTYAVPGTNAILAYRVSWDGKTAEITLCNRDVTGALTIPETIDGYTVVAIGDDAFYECIGLTSVVMPDTVRVIGDRAFYRCYRAQFVFSQGLERIGEEAFWVISMKKLVLPDSIVEIGKRAFADSSVNEVVLPASLQHIPEGLFKKCYYLHDVTFPTSLKSIGKSAFSECYELYSVTLPDGLEEIDDYAFFWCGPSRTYGAYYAAYNFKSVILPDTVKRIGKSAFAGCQALRTINLPDGLKELSDSLFNGCYTLQNVIIPESVTQIGDSAFFSCERLSSINIPENVIRIGKDAFSSCEALKEVVLPNGLAVLEKEAFSYCKNLEKVTISAGIIEIQKKAFDFCNALKTVVFCWGAPAIDQTAFGFKVQATCYYPSNNPAWTTAMLQNYGAKKLTWIAMEMENPGDDVGGEGGNAGGDSGEGGIGGDTGEGDDYGGEGNTGGGSGSNPGGSGGNGGDGTGSGTESGSGSHGGVGGDGEGHNFSNWTQKIAPTCTAIGKEEGTCACGAVESRIIPALGHRFDSVVTTPTCTEQGYTVKTCSVCQEVETTDFVEATGHQWGVWVQVKAPTCVDPGAEMRMCNCGASEVQTTEKGPHDYENDLCSGCGDVAAYHVVLTKDAVFNRSLQQDLYVDLAGYDMTGTIVANGFKVYVMDSTTDAYNCENVGYFTCVDEKGNFIVPERIYTVGEKQYMAICNEDRYSFHRFFVGITHMTLEPEAVGLGYKTVIFGDEMVMTQLAEKKALSFRVQLEGYNPVYRRFDRNELSSGNTIALRIRNFDVENYSEHNLYAQVSLTLSDGTVIETEQVDLTFRWLAEQVNENYEDYTSDQLARFKAMLQVFDIVKKWDLSNLI